MPPTINQTPNRTTQNPDNFLAPQELSRESQESYLHEITQPASPEDLHGLAHQQAMDQLTSERQDSAAQAGTAPERSVDTFVTPSQEVQTHQAEQAKPNLEYVNDAAAHAEIANGALTLQRTRLVDAVDFNQNPNLN